MRAWARLKANLRGLLTSRPCPGFLISLLVALPATFPLFRPGFFISHDGLFHLYRLAALDQAVHAGEFYPRWFPDFAFGYGYPVLNFYSPLSYYLSELPHLLGMGYVAALKFAFAAGLILSGLTMYLWVRGWLNHWGALLASAVYVYFPYHLADAYVRGALAESLAFVFFPLILWCFFCYFAEGRTGHVMAGGASYALLILTHNLSAWIFTPVLLAYLILLSLTGPRDKQRLCQSFGALLLGLGLAAFYWLPILGEGQWVHLREDFNSTGYQRHLVPLTETISPFLIYRYFPDQGVKAEHPLGLVAAISLILGALAAAWSWQRHRGPWHSHAVFLGLVALGSVFMVSLPSLLIWKLFQPFLSMLQYPWRFMALHALGVAGVSAALGLVFKADTSSLDDRRPWLERLAVALTFVILLVPFITSSLWRLPMASLPVGSEDDLTARMWAQDATAGQIGATWTAEYLPVWVEEERWAIPRPRAGRSDAEFLDSKVSSCSLTSLSYSQVQLELEAAGNTDLIFHQFYYPAWNARIDGQAVPVLPMGKLGLAAIAVPAGRHKVDFRYDATLFVKLGGWLSVLALLAFVAHSARRSPKAVISLVTAGLALALVMAMHRRGFEAPSVLPRDAKLGEEVRLVGLSLNNARLRPGETLRVKLVWLALKPTREDLKAFVHLLSIPAGRLVGQHDGDPVGGYTPTSRWYPGEIVLDEHDITMPKDLSPGKYRLIAGLYRFPTLDRLKVSAGSDSVGDDAIDLGQVEVIGTRP